MQLPSRYPYYHRWRTILGGFVFFGACSAFMAYKASHNNVGLYFFHKNFITLGTSGATAFYWVIAALGGVFVLAALVLALRRIVNPGVLELKTDALLLPHGFLQTQTSRIRYTDIQELSEAQVSGQTVLYLTVYERRFTITASLFSDTTNYVAVRDFLLSQTRH